MFREKKYQLGNKIIYKDTSLTFVFADITLEMFFVFLRVKCRCHSCFLMKWYILKLM